MDGMDWAVQSFSRPAEARTFFGVLGFHPDYRHCRAGLFSFVLADYLGVLHLSCFSPTILIVAIKAHVRNGIVKEFSAAWYRRYSRGPSLILAPSSLGLRSG